MRNKEHHKLSELLKDFVETHHLEKGLDAVNVRNAWHSLMGNGVSNYTTGVTLKGAELHVSLSSSVLREELSYGKEKIIAMLNEALGKELVKKLVLR
ncbi:MAG TPA: DUF721 domain-containing protein [Flavobacteriaceae bacterium]|nr:DUF721 domain-containing protein [Flavobacteriaceae bacterium]